MNPRDRWINWDGPDYTKQTLRGKEIEPIWGGLKDDRRWGIVAIWRARELGKEAEAQLQQKWFNEAQEPELARWCRKELDNQTDATLEARRRKANRELPPVSMNHWETDNEGEVYFPAADQAAYQAWQREQLPAPQWLEDWRWFWFWESLSEPEQVTLRLLAEGRSGRMVARLLGVTENMVRKRRMNAAQKLWHSGIPYEVKGAKPDRGPEWCARREAPSVRVRTAPSSSRGTPAFQTLSAA